MGRLILCTGRTAKRPFYISELGLSLYTAEELCYYIYNNIFMIEDSFVSPQLLAFIGSELGLTQLEDQLRQHLGHAASGQLLLTILQEIHYYDESELTAFKKQLEKKKSASSFELAKNKADFLVKQKKYNNALKVYDSILDGPDQKGMTEEFCARIWHNKGVAYAGLFYVAKAAQCMLKAYETLKDNEIVREIYMLSLFDEEAMDWEEIFAGVSPKQLYSWKEEFENIRKQLMQSGKALEARTVFQKDAVKRPAFIAGLLGEWKQEYREMVL